MADQAAALTPEEQKIKELEAKLKAVQDRRDSKAAALKLAELEAKLKAEERALQEEEFELTLKEKNPDGELGIDFDFLRFGAHLVAFKKAAGPQIERWTKRLPKDNSQPHPSEVRNLARPCVLVVHLDGQPASEAGAAFDTVAEQFPGAPVEIVNILLEMAKGAAARRRGK